MGEKGKERGKVVPPAFVKWEPPLLLLLLEKWRPTLVSLLVGIRPKEQENLDRGRVVGQE